MSTETMTKSVKKVITVGLNRSTSKDSSVGEQKKSSGIPTWDFPSDKKDGALTLYTVCVTNADDMVHREQKGKSKGQFSPLLVEKDAVPKGYVRVGKVYATNINAALDEALDSIFYKAYIKAEPDDSFAD